MLGKTVFVKGVLWLLLLSAFFGGRPATGVASAGEEIFSPPSEESIPSGSFGDLVREGEQIFTNTQKYASQYVGNDLTCESCHLNRGRRAYSAPLWGAYGMYPRYRLKNHKVNSLSERMQGCFRFSMNGTAPDVDSRTVRALVAYSYWMSRGAPVGVKLPGAGMLHMVPPSRTPDPFSGKKIFEARCALCHGLHGQGRMSRGETAFPPVWGLKSFNKGAGLYNVGKLAGFIKMNMPLSKGDTLTDQDAWDVAAYVDSQPRPEKPVVK